MIHSKYSLTFQSITPSHCFIHSLTLTAMVHFPTLPFIIQYSSGTNPYHTSTLSNAELQYSLTLPSTVFLSLPNNVILHQCSPSHHFPTLAEVLSSTVNNHCPLLLFFFTILQCPFPSITVTFLHHYSPPLFAAHFLHYLQTLFTTFLDIIMPSSLTNL